MSFDFLTIENPWWRAETPSRSADHHLRTVEGSNHYVVRQQFIQKYRTFQAGDVFIVRGARQVGKTTLIKEWISNLLTSGTPGPAILYMSCETLQSYQELQRIIVAWIQDRIANQRLFLFLDEISFVKEWQRAILWCANAGLLQKATVVVSGSNARDLKESSERLPGRRGYGEDLAIYPATPLELRTLACFEHLSDRQLTDLYLRMGGFPHAVRDVAISGYVSDETYQTYRNWIIGDAARYDLSIESLRHMMYRVCATSGSRITLSSIIDQTPLKSHETGLRYLEHLEDSFLCRMLYCYDPDLDGPSYHKSRKVYFIDPLLYYLADAWKIGITNIWELSGHLLTERTVVGTLLESSVIAIASRDAEAYFWYSSKTKKEADLVLKRAGQVALFDVKLSPEPLSPQLGRPVEAIGMSGLLHQDWIKNEVG